MPLLKSLFCFKGLDNGRRYLLISVSCYLLFIFLSPVLDKAFILLFLLLVITTPILTATAIRRIHDASLPKSFAFATPLVYWLCVLLTTYIKHDATWFLLILAGLVTLVTCLLNKTRVRKNNQYIFGYSGPVDLTANSSKVYQHQSFHQRIEPTLTPKNLHPETNQAIELNTDDFLADPAETPTSQSFFDEAATKTYSENQFDWYQQLTDWFAINRKIKILSIASFFVVVILSIMITQLMDDPAENQQIKELENIEPAKQRLNKIEMPDNFWVMHDENDAITIGWQGDISKDGDLWSAKTAIGDNQCAELVFGRDDKFRSLRVIIKNQGDYYADFSPLDSKAIIKAIALKSKFSLCGFEFSLKGTQAKLMNNKKYSAYFDEE